MEPNHLRLDLSLTTSRAIAVHDEECPEIGPVCQVRNEPPQLHRTTLWLSELRVLAEYGLVPHLALQGVVPFRLIDTRTTYSNLEGNRILLDYPSLHHRNETLVGPGDPQLWIHHGVRIIGWELSERIGVNFPVGKMRPNPFRLAAEGLPHEHIQFGTGTVDPLLGIDLAKVFGSWSLNAFAQGQVPLYRNRFGYKAGARFVGGVAASTGLGLKGPAFRLGVTAVHEFAERWDGVVPTADGNQGRTDLFFGPGFTIPFAGDWSASIDLQARVYGRVVGAQLEMPIVVAVSIGRLFHLERGFDERPPTSVVTTLELDVEDVVDHGEAVPLVPVSGKWTIYDFWAPWCESCKTLDAELRRLASHEVSLAIRRINIVDFDSPISKQELPSVSVLPHVRLIRPDGTLAFEESGSPPDLIEMISKGLSSKR